MPETDTTLTKLVPLDESHIGSVSVRAIIACILVGCVCTVCTYGAIQSKDFEVHEPMYSLVMFAVGFLFGQKQNKP